eukprot:gene21286-24156_t
MTTATPTAPYVDVESQKPIYATEVQPVQVLVVQPEENVPQDNEADDPWIVCAFCGLMFSWIPIIGCLTFVANMNAPRRSLRGSLARAACTVATLVVLFNIIFWSWYT